MILMKFFDHDAPFFKTLSLLADVAIVSFLWVITSLFIITIGASTTAAYYVLTRRINDMESQVFMDFLISFKRNFVKSTIIFLLIMVLAILNIFNLIVIYVPGMLGYIINIVQVLIAFELLFIFIHVFPLTARFDMKILQLIKSALVFANKHFLTTIAHILIIVIIVLICYLLPVLFFFAFGIYCWLSSYLMIRLFRKYRPEMDIDPDLEENNNSDIKS